MPREETGLVRSLTLADTTALVVGTVIGTGVFLKTAVMAQDLGSPALVLLAWVAAGLLSLAGALTYAELGAMLPQAGGEYLYLRHSYGEAAAFAFGWMRFFVHLGLSPPETAKPPPSVHEVVRVPVDAEGREIEAP